MSIQNQTSTEVVQSEPTDEALMTSIQGGDSEALEVIMHRYKKLLKCAILRTVHDDADADDVLSRVWLELWHKADKYSSKKGKPLTWLMTSSRREAIDHLRRKTAYTRAKERMEEETSQNLSAILNDNEVADSWQHILICMADIPEKQAELIKLCFLKGLTQREAAHATHTPLGTTKTRIELGLKKLRGMLVRQKLHAERISN